MADLDDLKTTLFYYFRHKYYTSMLNLAKEALSHHKSDPYLQLYYPMALFLTNRLEEAINELESLKSNPELHLAAIIGLLYCNTTLKVDNSDLYHSLDADMRSLRKTAQPAHLYHSALVLFIVRKPEKALDYVEKALESQPNFTPALTLKGWLQLHLNRPTKSEVLFEEAANGPSKDLNASLGLSQAYLAQNKLDEALNAANKAQIRFSSTHLPLNQKIRVQFASGNFEHALESVNQLLITDANNFYALKVNILILLVKDCNFEEAVLLMRQLSNEIEVKESKNYELLLDFATLFAKLSNENAKILAETYKMAEKAVQIRLESTEAIVELANQAYQQKQLVDAVKFYKMALRFDDSCFEALLGLATCQLRQNGQLAGGPAQLDALLELESAQTSPKLYFLRAQLSDSRDDALVFLKKASDLLLGALKCLHYGEEYLQALNPPFLIDLVREFVRHCQNEGKGAFRSGTDAAYGLLRAMMKACPGRADAAYYLAKVQFFGGGGAADAMQTLESVLPTLDDAYVDAYLLLAQIQLDGGQFERAAQSLEVGLSRNFAVREMALYHRLRGNVAKQAARFGEAVEAFSTALDLVRTGGAAEERAELFVELIEAHFALGQVEEAARLVQAGLEEFSGSGEVGRFLILGAEQAVARGDVQEAVEMLGKVGVGEKWYLEARTRLAEVLLRYRMDRFAYLECYKEMVEESPKPETLLLLGDAYMTVLEPDDALECYKQALQHRPKDVALCERMGRALIETHYFSDAITFYTNAIRLTGSVELKLQLADLHMQLKDYEKSQILLMTELEGEDESGDVTFLRCRTKLLSLLAKTQERAGNLVGAVKSWKDARDNQNRVRKRIMVDQTHVPEVEVQLLVNIGVKLAEISTAQKNNNDAIQFYKDTLEIRPNDEQIQTALAKLYMQMNLLDPCQQICSSILRINPENETASVMMADIAFRKIDFDMALFHFTQLLTKEPTNWQALARQVEILRRTGNLQEVPEYLSNAEKSLNGSVKKPGFLYCTALYQMYSGNLNGALRNFNAARQDPEWGLLSLCYMIEICLNPDDELLGEQFVEEDLEYRDSRSMALKTADRLLAELKTRLDATATDLLKYKLLANFRLLAAQQKPAIERALDTFLAIGAQATYKDHPGPILGMATAHTLLKQTQRAKNQLKRVAKAPWSLDDADHLERCWLLLADFYIQSAKFYPAGELLAKVVQHNGGCGRAFEHLGFIAEKEQRGAEACVHYEKAWRFGGRTNLGVGFRLAHNLMKARRFAEAYEVGVQILKVNGDYPKVKKDILEKAMNNFRV